MPLFYDDAVKKLGELYGLDPADVNEKLTVLSEVLNIHDKGSVVWLDITNALVDRERNAPKAIESIQKLLSITDITPKLTQEMKQLEKEFTALFAAHKIKGASYHFYGHGIEMSQDPGNFLKALLPKDTSVDPLITAITNALGAAHDIIQGNPPPRNERESAKIFEELTQQMIDNLIHDFGKTLTPEQLTALEDFKTKGIPFLAEECIVNSTYLLFNSGKRDFDNVLLLTHKALAPTVKSNLDPLTAAMKMSMALSDTRRSEMKSVLIKLEVLNNIPRAQLGALELLLQNIHLIEPDQTIEELKRVNNKEKLMQIEGYLLRMGQNIRMTAELAAVYGKEKGPERVALIRALRTNTADGINIDEHLRLFLNNIPGDFGEAAFAKALGKIDHEELRQQAEFYGLTLSEEDLDFSGWARHVEELEASKRFLEAAPPALPIETRQSIALMLFTIAAKSPGHRVTKETYEAMKEVLPRLQDPELQRNLHDELEEIRLANPDVALKIKAPAGSGFFQTSPVARSETGPDEDQDTLEAHSPQQLPGS